MQPTPPGHAGRWDRVVGRREVLKLGGLLVVGAAAAPLLAACSSPSGSQSAPTKLTLGSQEPAVSGTITALVEGGDPTMEPALRKVFDDFKAQNPAMTWDIRGIPGFGPEWDRLARASLESGDPVGLVILDGLFVRAWARDGLLEDLGADPRLADVLARVPDKFHLGGLGEATTRAFPLALTQRRPHHGPVLQQGAARPGGSRAAEDRRGPQGHGRSHWRHSASHHWSIAAARSPSTRCWSCGCCP